MSRYIALFNRLAHAGYGPIDSEAVVIDFNMRQVIILLRQVIMGPQIVFVGSSMVLTPMR